MNWMSSLKWVWCASVISPSRPARVTGRMAPMEASIAQLDSFRSTITYV
jgi:hypothetical protein